MTAKFNLDRTAPTLALTGCSLIDSAMLYYRFENIAFLNTFIPLNKNNFLKMNPNWRHKFQENFFKYLKKHPSSLTQIGGILSIFLETVLWSRKEDAWMLNMGEILNLIQHQRNFPKCGPEYTEILKIYLRVTPKKLLGGILYAILLGLDIRSTEGRTIINLAFLSKKKTNILENVFHERDLLLHYLMAIEDNINSSAFIHFSYIHNANQDHPKLLPYLLQALNVLRYPEKFTDTNCESILAEAKKALDFEEEKWVEYLETEFTMLRLLPDRLVGTLINRAQAQQENTIGCRIA